MIELRGESGNPSWSGGFQGGQQRGGSRGQVQQGGGTGGRRGR
jgi:hypothetical protein